MKIITDPVDLTKKLVNIPSESGKEEKIIQYLFDYLQGIGLKPRLQKVSDKRCNVFVVGKGDTLFNGHIDTVPLGERKLWKYDPLGEITKGKLYGRGSCDTKGPIACFLSALAKHPNNNINISFMVGEEDTFIGIKTLMQLRKTTFKHIKYCFELEPTDIKIVTAHKGQVILKISTIGKAAHGSVPEAGENAILKMNKVMTVIEKYTQDLRKKKDKMVGCPTINIGVIKGGQAANIVPDYAEIVIDRRVIPSEDIKTVIRDFTLLLKPAKIEVVRTYPPVELKADTRIVTTLQEVLKQMNMDNKPIGVNYTTQFSEMMQYGIEGCIFGPGKIDQAHRIDEHVELDDLRVGYEVFGEVLRRM